MKPWRTTDLEAIRNENEPMRRALAMVEAVAEFLNDLDDEEPGDDEARFAPLLERAQRKAQDLVNVLHDIVEGQ